MDAFFVDDSRQRASRRGMGRLAACGGVYVPEASITLLENSLNRLCQEFDFPDGEEFKWSPGRELWMRDNLVYDDREEFFRRALEAAREFAVKAIVVVEDTTRGTASADTSEEDVVQLFLERANHIRGPGAQAIVIADRPGGGRAAEDRFIARCLATLREGTRFVVFDRITRVVTTPSSLWRLLQLADVVTGCTAARVGGQRQYAEPVFESVLPILRGELGRKGGVGLKIQPDLRYANLYHWLLGDDYLVRYPIGHPLPDGRLPYAESPYEP